MFLFWLTVITLYLQVLFKDLGTIKNINLTEENPYVTMTVPYDNDTMPVKMGLFLDVDQVWVNYDTNNDTYIEEQVCNEANI